MKCVVDTWDKPAAPTGADIVLPPAPLKPAAFGNGIGPGPGPGGSPGGPSGGGAGPAAALALVFLLLIGGGTSRARIGTLTDSRFAAYDGLIPDPTPAPGPTPPLFGPDAFADLSGWTLAEQFGGTASISAGAWGLAAGLGSLWATIWNLTALPVAGTKFYVQATVTNAANSLSYTKFALLFSSSANGEIEGSGTPHGYVVYYHHGSTSIKVRRRSGGAPSTIYSPAVTFANGDVLRVEVKDNGTSVDIQVFKNGSSVGSFNDAAPPAGRGLIWGINVYEISNQLARCSLPSMGTV